MEKLCGRNTRCGITQNNVVQVDVRKERIKETRKVLYYHVWHDNGDKSCCEINTKCHIISSFTVFCVKKVIVLL